MIHIHCTKKLFDKLPLDDDGRLPVKNSAVLQSDSQVVAGQNPLSDWQGNLITLQRRNCILLVHEATRFPLLLPCLTKPDYRNLQWLFEDVLMNTLLKMGVSEQQMDTASRLLEPLVLDNRSDRSVMGTLNQMKGRLESLLWVDNANIQDLNAYRVSNWLAEAPCGIKGQSESVWPNEAILELLDLAADKQVTISVSVDDRRQQEQLPDNVVSMHHYRKTMESK
ncbi:DUF6933 domain-containing protein [Oceanospirillum sediminis]|uniref:DUF6933 domain-containing protein n=1 Tax=Oceanospirillum sediminis TaxID=2760088 RepID=A0A839IVJ2_9GAMM|nr:hypothetical protein [Oceanospirillum sediminis]MBB1488634.1 hypothetical protein [Oceanospirillum sediminis]